MDNQNLQNPPKDTTLEMSPNQKLNPIPPLSPAAVPPFSAIPSIQPITAHPATKKIKWLVISILSLLLLGACGVFGYMYFFPAPEKVLQKMALRIPEITTIDYSGNLVLSVDKVALENNLIIPLDKSSSNSSNEEFSIVFNGISDLRQVENPQNSFAFTTDIKAFKENGKLGLEFRNIEKAFYIRLTSAPDFGLFSLKPIENTWLKIEQKQIDEQFNTEELIDKKESIENELNPEKIKQLRDEFFKAQVIKVTQTLPTETIDGRKMWHYRYIIDKEGIKRFVQTANTIMGQKTFTAEDLAKMDEDLEKTDTPTGEIWIGKKDYLPYKLTVSSIFKNINDTEGNIISDLTLQVKNYNQPVAIEVPTPTKNFEEFIVALFSAGQGMFGGMEFTQDNVATDYIDSDNDELLDHLEAEYGTDKNNPDTDGDGYDDSTEISSGYNPTGPGKNEDIWGSEIK
jgi:hypothetical protein